MTAELALTFVVPMYNAASSITALVRDIEQLGVDGGHEIVLVNDGSTDATVEVCRDLLRTARVPITLVEHARNFGEHNAVLTGWRHARGRHIVNLDDDGQNPPREAVRLWQHARLTGLDVVFGHYEVKQHSVFRNFGSWLTNKVTDYALDKPHGFYLSSFRCVSAFVAHQVEQYSGPYPYIDGLLLQITQRIGSIVVAHEPRRSGESGYTFRKLFRLWLSAWINFSLLPLRLATVLGLLIAGVGVCAFVAVCVLWLMDRGPRYGFGWMMSAFVVFSGTQLVMLGLIGEYLGRVFLAVNQTPQSVVRQITTSQTVHAADSAPRINVAARA
ncbi:MAG: glycosyltransferase [Acidobacteriaceae bacterium]|jgi:undecaprenyl-phosphate 4-deoxy-4-formamido-L-arabinose transferase|nr:glycosyltransferase [Acidobacteriaceae bacterium]